MTSRFLTLFQRQILRQSWRHPLLASLNILSIALGVAVFLAIQIGNREALASFRAAAGLVSGKADLEIRGPSLPDDLAFRVARLPGVQAATPLVEGIVGLPGRPGEYLRILGVDPFTGADLFAFRLKQAGGATLNLEQWLSDPAAIAVPTAQAAQWDLTEGILPVLAGTNLRELRPVFLFETDQFLPDSRVAAMDIGWAQELLGLSGTLTSLQILLDDPSTAEAVSAALRDFVPLDAVVAPPAARSQEMETMLQAFQLNLTAMSLVSLIVGMFLIFNSVSASVVRRRVEIAILRASGATRLEIRALFLGEAALAALVGSALGLLFAPALASLVARPLSQTVSALYDLVTIMPTSLEPWQIVEAFAVGCGAALVAAWMPAGEAARCDPARILHPGSAMEQLSPLKKSGLILAPLSLLAAAGLCAFVLNGGPKLLGFAAAALVLIGFSLLIPWLTAGVALCVRPAGVLVRLAADHLLRSLHRNAITIAALSAAVAMAVSVTVMIHSFRASVQRWIEHTLVADLYVAPALNEIAGLQAFLPAGAAEWAAEQPGVAKIATFREMTVRFHGENAALAVVDGPARGRLAFVQGGATASAQFAAGESVAVSESFARRFAIQPGATLALPSPEGEVKLPVCGIYRDFTRDSGIILLPRTLFSQYWRDDRLHSVSLILDGSRSRDEIAAAFRERFGAEGQFAIYDNASLRQRVFEIFDQTFAVTSLLRAVAIFVAAAGVLFSLSVLVIEREREIGVLRALGSSRGQVLGLVLGEATLIGVAASLSGLASGGALAMVLTWVINQAFFGWTIELTYPLAPLAVTPLWLIPSALVAALLPAWRATRIPPAQAVRFE